jgi:hypothetical protein
MNSGVQWSVSLCLAGWSATNTFVFLTSCTRCTAGSFGIAEPSLRLRTMTQRADKYPGTVNLCCRRRRAISCEPRVSTKEKIHSLTGAVPPRNVEERFGTRGEIRFSNPWYAITKQDSVCESTALAFCENNSTYTVAQFHRESKTHAT